MSPARGSFHRGTHLLGAIQESKPKSDEMSRVRALGVRLIALRVAAVVKTTMEMQRCSPSVDE